MQEKIIKKRIIKIEDFFEKRFKPSVQTKYNFIKIFDKIYPYFSKTIDIKSLEWDRSEFRLMLIDKESWEILHFLLKDNFGVKKCNWVLCTNNLCNWIHYEVQNEVFLKFLVYFVVKAESFKLENFLEILTRDFKAKKEYYQIFWKQNRPPFSIIQNWWHKLQKYRFLVHEWIIRNMDQSISLNLPEASIHHSERECQWISPNNKETGYHFFNFPNTYYNHNFDKYYYLIKEEKQKYLEWENTWQSIWLSTDLDEDDIVMWKGTDKLTQAIDYAVKNAKKNNIKMLSFNCCCVPRIVWDDIYSVLKKAKQKIDIPFIFQWQLEKTPYEQKILLLEEYLNKIDKTKIKKIKNSISIFGYHENFYQKELWDILKENWVKINTSFIPSIDIRLLELMFKSELFVFSPNNFQKEVFEYPFQSFQTNFIKPKYPYWLQNSINWLKEILDYFNIDFVLNEKYTNIEENYISKVNYVKNKKYNIGIVLLWLQEVKKICNPDYMNNIDVIWFLEEMWFELNFYILDDFKWYITRNDDTFRLDDWDHEKIEKVLYSQVNDKNKIKINYFNNKVDLEEILKNDNINLIYSDIYFDRRIINLWLNQFNLKNFYVWYSGALKTIEELISLIEMNFYKNYSKYFFN